MLRRAISRAGAQSLVLGVFVLLGAACDPGTDPPCEGGFAPCGTGGTATTASGGGGGAQTGGAGQGGGTTSTTSTTGGSGGAGAAGGTGGGQGGAGGAGGCAQGGAGGTGGGCECTPTSATCNDTPQGSCENVTDETCGLLDCSKSCGEHADMTCVNGLCECFEVMDPFEVMSCLDMNGGKPRRCTEAPANKIPPACEQKSPSIWCCVD